MEEAPAAASSSSLRPLCARLLELPAAGIEAQSPAIATAEALETVLEALPAAELKGYHQYVLFPLVLLIDAAVVLRSKSSKTENRKVVVVSDQLAERVASCLGILLGKCPVEDVQEATTLLRKLVGAAMLTPDEASEEFRDAIIKCLAAMFQQMPPLGIVAERLRSEEMAPAIGHLFSVLLQISHTEAARAGSGSGAIRAEALATLRIIVKKVASADALAFFLPGVASGLGKVIKSAVVSNRRSSSVRFYSVGAAGSSRSVSEAILALAELLVIVLADERKLKVTNPRIQIQEQEAIDVLQNLQNLQNLSRRAIDQQQLALAESNTKQERKIMRVEFNDEWVNETGSRIEKLLTDVLRLLCAHPAAAVRIALVEATGQIIRSCNETLKACIPMLLETLLVLSCDDSSSVADAANGHLLLLRTSNSALGSSFDIVLNRLLEDLPRVIVSTDDVSALLHARRLAAAMYFSGPVSVFSTLFKSPSCISRFVTVMMQSLSIPSTLASSIGYVDSGGYTLTKLALEHDNPEAGSDGEVARDQLPRIAPWFVQAGKAKLYVALASTLRLAGFASLRCGIGRQSFADLLLLLQSTVRHCAATGDEVHGSGQSQRSAAAAACALNEIVYGTSGAGLHGSVFGSSDLEEWRLSANDEFVRYVGDTVGDVLNDYMASELWDLAVDCERGDEGVLRIFEDNAMLQQMLIEGVGVFGISLGRCFESSGYLGLVIYPLLEKLGSSRYSISHAASISLRAICHNSGYVSVKKLVVGNLDYVVDSLCRQLRHIEIYPRAPEFLTAILQQTGAAADLLPLLEEPMRGLLQELEIFGRHNHPYLTVPILKALREITRAARHESFEMDSNGSTSAMDVLSDPEQNIQRLLQRKRCQHSVLTVASSCILSSAPLLASKNPQARILALDIIEDGAAALSKIEAAYKSSNLEWEQAMESYERSQGNLSYETPDRDPNDGNKLLPGIHQTWPHVVNCLRSENSAVLARCLHAIAFIARECGGSFLARRLHKDALPIFLRLLQDGPLPGGRLGLDKIVAKSSPSERGLVARDSPATVRKVQQATLQCIKSLSEDEKSAKALDLVFEPLAGAVVSLACSKSEVKDLAADTAVAMSSIDPDLVWVMVADLAYGPGHNQPAAPSPAFPSCSEILPPLASDSDALCSQYAGREFRLDTSCPPLKLLAKLENALCRYT